MDRRALGRTHRDVGVIGFGGWQIGDAWGQQVAHDEAVRSLHAAADEGVTFFDTADVYGDGRSEQLVGRFLAERADDAIVVATKMGRRADPHTPDAYAIDSFRAWNDRSRANLGVETIDLVQLHCPPSQVYDSDAAFDAMDTLVEEGRFAAYGVSVETCAEALAAIRRPHVATVQIILNIFRRKPLEEVLPAAEEAGVGVIARVPLASGLLSGRYDEHTTFAPDDHRTFNRRGDSFDVGETFAGVPFEVGVQAAREVAALTPEGATTAQMALRWVVDQPGVTVVIPGARNVEQAEVNAAAGDLPSLPPATLDALEEIYDTRIREHVHDRW